MSSSAASGEHRILFVDDEPLAREAFACSLSEKGFTVDVAGSSSEAVGLCQRYDYPVVATDWRMPHVDGLQLVKYLKPALPDAAYLLVTGAPTELSGELERASSVDGVIAKPWTGDALASAVERAIGVHAQRARDRRRPSPGVPPCRVLLLEDNPGDALLVTKQLRKVSRREYEVHHAARLSEAHHVLEREAFQVALVDLSLPDASGLEAIRSLGEFAPTLPIVVLSGFNDEPLALEAVQAGAQDYLVKGEVGANLLHRSVSYAIERKRVADQLNHLAHHDNLTGLANRTLFRERLGRAVSHARRSESRVALLFIDLDHFKSVNDTLGHDVGDMLLERVARCLLDSVREVDTVARLGGDEFAVLIERVDDDAEVPPVAERILRALSEPMDLGGHETSVSASIGVSFFPDHGETLDQLLKAADAAMYQAKRRGRNRYECSEDAKTAPIAPSRRDVELRRAVEREEFELFYQPQLSLATGSVSGVEALLRWQHPARGLVSPVEFIPLLEQTGLIVPVGEWALEQACRQVREWRERGFPDLTLAVNLSARQFDADGLPEAVGRALSGVAGDGLELEITESTLLEDSLRIVRVLEQLKALGVRIAIDDFGTGYASLSYLRRVPVDCLKIDRAFVADIGQEHRRLPIASAIVALARELDLRVVAEGVETEDQLREVQGCDAVQGFLYSPPRSAGDLWRWLTQFDSERRGVGTTSEDGSALGY